MKNYFPTLRQNIRLTHILFIVIVLLGLFNPKAMSHIVKAIRVLFATYFDWFILLACMGFVVFCVFLAFSRYGTIKLGGPEDAPQFRTRSWISMLFAAGMGTGLVFYGAAEPVIHMVAPPPALSVAGQDISDALRARDALVYTYLHWGFHAWAIYGVCALTIAYFSFRHKKPMLASAPISAYWTSPNLKPLWYLVDMCAVLAVVFGLVSTLCQGVTQMERGVSDIGISTGSGVYNYILILGAITAVFIASAISGLGKGVKTLSNINMFITVLLMVFVLVVGPTHFIMESLVTTVGDYVSRIFSLGLDLRNFNDGGAWTQDWTITYLLWWIAWGPFVGVFVARISRGRTIRQFILGVLFVPTVFSFVWFSALGGTAIHMDMFMGTDFGAIALNDLSKVTFALLQELPFPALITVTAIFLLFIFLVTSADSGSYVLGMFASNGDQNPQNFQKLFWGMIIAIVTFIFLVLDHDIQFMRGLAVIGALPYLFIMIMQCFTLWKFLKKDMQAIERKKINAVVEDVLDYARDT
ncbi:MAG: BCCT family transporter [Pseudomonadota bacterium]